MSDQDRRRTRRLERPPSWTELDAQMVARRVAKQESPPPTSAPEEAFVRLITWRNEGRERFLGAVTEPWLIFPEGFDATRTGMRTLTGHSAGVTGIPAAVKVQKTGVPFSFMITIGRAPNNDVVIPDPRVSKFHCYVRTAADGTWQITEASALNGTQVDGLDLERGSSLALRSGALISFGGARGIFHSPESLYLYLHEAFPRPSPIANATPPPAPPSQDIA